MAFTAGGRFPRARLEPPRSLKTAHCGVSSLVLFPQESPPYVTAIRVKFQNPNISKFICYTFGFLFKNPVMKLTQLNKSIPKENKNEKELEFICKVTSPNSFEKILIFYNFFMMIL